MTVPIPVDECARLESLRQYEILGTLPEQEYDDIARLASQICGTPIALITLLDKDRQWFKAKIGVQPDHTPRTDAFCAHTILQDELLIVPDATHDARFADNPWVTGEQHIRFYAGIPLQAPNGQALGSLCVLDRKPRRLTAEQRDGLRILSQQVMARLELRRTVADLERAADERRRAYAALRESEQRFYMFVNQGPAIAFLKDEDGRYLYVNEPCARYFEREVHEWLGRTDQELWEPQTAQRLRSRDLQVLADADPTLIEETIRMSDGRETCWLSYKFVLQTAGQCKMLGGLSMDITERKQNDLRREQLVKDLKRALHDVKTLKGLLPICASCKNIRDDAGYWQQIDAYLAEHSNLEFTHGLCPDCMERFYPESAQILRETPTGPYGSNKPGKTDKTDKPGQS